MPQEIEKAAQEIRTRVLSTSSCFACGPRNPRGLHLVFQQRQNGEMTADWIPEPDLEGYLGIVHGGLVSTVLDEAMAKVVDASGAEALTAELRVRFRRQVSPRRPAHVRGWIASRNKHMIKTEAVLSGVDGVELAHAWAIFLELNPETAPRAEEGHS